MIYLTSDSHFSHENIIKYCDRPFLDTDVDGMDKTMINNWNSIVKPNDSVYHLGDVGHWKKNKEWIKNIIPKLNGKKFLVPGNHDMKLLKELEKVFTILPLIYTFKNLTKDGWFNFVLCHYPILEWPGKFHGAIHCYGHTHCPIDILGPNAVDISMDGNKFTPVSLEEIIVKVTKNNLAEYDNINYKKENRYMSITRMKGKS